MAEVKKTAPAKDKALEADILNEATKANSKPITVEGTGENKVDHAGMQEQATQAARENIGTGKPAPHSENCDNDAKADYIKRENEASNTSALHEAAKAEFESRSRLSAMLLRLNNKVTMAHEDLVKKYGENYVIAQRGDLQQVFTAIAWKNLGGNKNQDGWREVIQTPPEVKALRK